MGGLANERRAVGLPDTVQVSQIFYTKTNTKPVLRGIQWPEVAVPGGEWPEKMSRSSTQTATRIIAAALRAHGSQKGNDLAEEIVNIPAQKWRFGYQKYIMELTKLMAESETEFVCKMAQAGISESQKLFECISEYGHVYKMSTCTTNPDLIRNKFKTGRVIG